MAKFSTGTATLDRTLHIANASRGFFRFIGWEDAQQLEQSVCAEDYPHLKLAIERAFESGHNMAAYRVLRPDGSMPWVFADIVRKSMSDGSEFVKLNIQDAEHLEEELASIQDELYTTGAYLELMDETFFFYNIKSGEFQLFIGGANQKVFLFNGTLREWEQSLTNGGSFQGRQKDSFNAFCDDLRQGARHFVHEMTLPSLTKDGDEKGLYLLKGRTLTSSAGENSVIGCIYMIAKDSRRKKTRLSMDNCKDATTGLLNKQTITDYIKNTLDGKPEGNYYLCVLDIDNFKYVNDNFGHMFGDEVLMTVADILKDAVGERGVVGRIGGDEMLLLLEKIKDRADLKSILRTIRTNVEWAYKGIRDDVHVTCSIGIAGYPKDGSNYDVLFKIADKMLYRAKENGKNRYIIYIPEIHGDLDGDMQKIRTPLPAGGLSKQGKEYLVLRLMEHFLNKNAISGQMLLNEVGPAFNLVEAHIIHGEFLQEHVFWGIDGRERGTFEDIFDTVKFRQLFDENNLAVIHHVYDLEFSCPEAYAYLNDRQITSALVYRMETKEPGYVAFFRSETSSRLWADSDKAYLNFISKMIELYINDKK